MTDEERELEDMGPIDYLMVEFPKAHVTGEGMQELVRLVDRGLIRVLDLVFIGKNAAGDVASLDLAELNADDTFDLGTFEGASAGLLDEEDIAEAGAVLEPGAVAAILIYENVWAAPLATTLRRNGAQLVASGRIPVQALIAALDATEADVSSASA